MLKMDYTPTSHDRITFRGRTWWADRRGYEGLAAFNSNWDQLYHHYLFTEDSVLLSYTRVFSPTIVNEFNTSYRVLGEIGAATSADNFDRVIRDKVGLGGLGQLYPAGNPLRIIPQASFGGIPNAANMTYDDRLPIDAGDERYIVLDNLSMTKGSHNLKFGFYYERNYASEGPRTLFGGSFAYDADANNPLNTGNAYANAALGVFRTYSEGSDRTTARNVIDLFEWFAQDSWRVNRRLTLDYGLRFSRATPYRFPERGRGGVRLRAVRLPQGAAAVSVRAQSRRAASLTKSGDGRVRTGRADWRLRAWNRRPDQRHGDRERSAVPRWIHPPAADSVWPSTRIRMGCVRRQPDRGARRLRRDQEHDSVVRIDLGRREQQPTEPVPAADLLRNAGYVRQLQRRVVSEQCHRVRVGAENSHGLLVDHRRAAGHRRRYAPRRRVRRQYRPTLESGNAT